jgi:hypothetical protein
MARAQTGLHLSLVSVDIWPEYDRPAVLVIYRITLAPETRLPADLVLHIPSNAVVNAVAIKDAAAGLVNTPYTITLDGQWSVVAFSTSSPQVQIEYYEPLIKDGSTRRIEFEWVGDHTVDKLEVNFLQPLGAENVQISSIPGTSFPDQDVLSDYQIQTGDLAQGQSFSMIIIYERQTDDLSISSLPVEAASTPGPDTPGRVSATGIIPWVMGVMGIFLIFSGIAWFAAWQKSDRMTTASRMHMPHNNSGENKALFCPRCGKRAQPEDLFCRECGTRFTRISTDKSDFSA